MIVIADEYFWGITYMIKPNINGEIAFVMLLNIMTYFWKSFQ